MKRVFGIGMCLLLAFSLNACEKASVDDGRMGNDDKFVTEEGPKETGREEAKESGRIDRAADESEGQETGEESEQGAENEIDLRDAFGDINGCAVIYLPAQEQYFLFREEMCRQEVSPYSTFKIVSALAGLQNGVILDGLSTMGYDGTDYGNPEWNEDLTLEQAFRKSCIWYFRKVIDAVGREEMQKELQELSYGNCDISEWNGGDINPMAMLNGFWLDSSLRISPLEQVKILEKIFEGQSGYDRENIAVLKQIMLTEETDTQKIYGKTGSSGNGEAWFVGFAETEGERKYFAVYLNDREKKQQISGNQAKEIALHILQ